MLLLPSASYGDSDNSHKLPAARRLSPSEIPSLLFHWTNPKGLIGMTPEVGSKLLHLKTINDQMALTKAYPALINLPGLFTWMNPITAIGASTSQFYATSDRTTGYPARLVVMRLKSDARAIELQSQSGIGGSKSPLNELESISSTVDLIKHVCKTSEGKIYLQEWIILNPKVIETYSADPVALNPILTEELRKLRDTNFLYTDSELHSKFLHVNEVDFRQLRLIPALEAARRPVIESVVESFANQNSPNAQVYFDLINGAEGIPKSLLVNTPSSFLPQDLNRNLANREGLLCRSLF